MVSIANIVCKAAGIAGLGVVVYDAHSTAKHHSSTASAAASADIFEKTVAAQRSNSTAGYATSAMQSKVADFRMKNPIVPIFAKISGFISGFISSLGDNFIPAGLSAAAIGAKGALQKAGAWGLGIYGIYLISKEGFGLGKTTPMDK